MSTALVPILEAGFASDPSTLKVDRAGGVIRNVRVLGLKSLHGREYTPEAAKAAVGLYEGAPIYIDHDYRSQAEKAARPRPCAEKLGWLEGVSVAPDGGLVAERLRLYPTHPQSGPVLDSAELNPAGFALSHDAHGKERREGGRVLIEGIAQVNSVDVVTRGATTKSLYEGAGTMSTLAQVRESLPANSPARGFLQLLEAEGMMVADAPMAVSGSDPDEALKAGFRAAIIAVVDDDSMDLAAKVSKIRELLKMHDKATGKEEKAETPAPGTEGKGTPAPAGDLAKLQESFNLRLKARDMCSEAGIIPGKTLRKALDACASEAEMTELIQEAKGQAPPPAAAQGGGWGSKERAPVVPVKEGAGAGANGTGGAKPPKDTAEFVDRMRGKGS